MLKYKIHKEETVFDDHYKITEAKVTYDSFKGKPITTRRLAFERGDSVAIVLFEKDSDSILLTNQFRYPTCKHHDGWLLEIPAGSMENNEAPEDCINREVLEELGYKIKRAELIHSFYTSPGASTELMFLFYAEVSQKDKIEKGGGNENESEDIQLIKIPVSQISKIILDVKDAKTILALQWYLLKNR
ncbi:MAG TPA: NUDIX hydrolase [Aequorivita sp.]|nr:NUDIX hydrolase [Aequorivita sp.]